MDSRPRRYLDVSSITDQLGEKKNEEGNEILAQIAFVLVERRVTIPNSMTCDSVTLVTT